MRRWSKPVLLVLLFLGLAWSAVFLWNESGDECGPDDLDTRTRRLAEDQGTKLRGAIIAYRERIGRYPDAIDDLGLPDRSLNASCGTRWGYSQEHGPDSIHLGEYSENGFILFWDARNKTWAWDT